jgi:signal transduction histidine kinase
MKETAIIELMQNIAMLLVFAMLYENFWLKNEASKNIWPKIISGLVLGGIGIILMLTPCTFISGVIFDARSIMLSISGLFLGPIPTIIAILLTGFFRVMMGGDGMWMGIAVIISSGTIGLLWRQYRTSWRGKNIYIELLVMGVIVHLVVTGCALLLPSDIILPTIKNIALPIMLIYSPGTMLLGILLLRQTNNYQNRLSKLEEIADCKQTEQELLAAKGKAEESDRLKSAFLANMSHEIRTPMNGILGFADLLQEQELTGEEQQEYISINKKSGERMLNIINDLIDISKVESGQMEISISETNVNELIEYIHAFFKPEVERKGMQIFFQSSLPAKKVVIKTDREKVYAILTNLVKNAIKYSDKGTIELGYNLKPTSSTSSLPGGSAGEPVESAELVFFVKDTGIGISKEKLETIFDRFVQVDLTNKRTVQGAGLGLAIAKAYVKMLGGKIGVESELGKGSTFYFTLSYNVGSEEIIAIKNVDSRDEEEHHLIK